MRKLLLVVVLIPEVIHLLTGTSFGIKGGLNYNANGDYFESASDSYEIPIGILVIT